MGEIGGGEGEREGMEKSWEKNGREREGRSDSLAWKLKHIVKLYTRIFIDLAILIRP